MGDRRNGQGRPGNSAGGHGVASLVGGGPSLVGPVGAMRARDVARPRDSDFARAEKTVVVRRRPLETLTKSTLLAEPDRAPAVTEADRPFDVDQSSAGASEPADS